MASRIAQGPRIVEPTGSSDVRCSVVCSDAFFSPVVLSCSFPTSETPFGTLQDKKAGGVSAASGVVSDEAIQSDHPVSNTMQTEPQGDFLGTDEDDQRDTGDDTNDDNDDDNEDQSSDADLEDIDVLYEDSPELAEAKRLYFYTEFVQTPLQAFADEERMRLAVKPEASSFSVLSRIAPVPLLS